MDLQTFFEWIFPFWSNKFPERKVELIHRRKKRSRNKKKSGRRG